MGYMHIENLYRPQAQRILQLRRVYALEKVHGTSTAIHYRAEGHQLSFHAGGESHPRFVGLFDQPKLLAVMQARGYTAVSIHGEGYGGKQQGMSATYGKDLAFIGFDAQVNGVWLDVPQAAALVADLGLEFVPYAEVECTVEALDRERDRPSVVAERRGMGADKKREGIVIRPLFELVTSDGERLMAKHKADAFAERATPPKVVDPAALTVLQEAEAIATEWVTPMRLQHVLDKLPEVTGIQHTSQVIKAMLEDVHREAAGEIATGKAVDAAISKRAAALYKAHVTKIS